MGRDRLNLHEILCDILGSRNCYFTPPASIQMRYPCIKYEINNIPSIYADNRRYRNNIRYEVVVIDRDQDSEIAKKLLQDERLIYLSSDRVYAVDNLYHYVFTVFY